MTERKTTRIDMHVHTRGSDGWGNPGEIVRYAKRAKLDGVCITDHHRTYTPEGLAVAQALWDAGLLAFHGCEYSTAWGHLLIYGVDVGEYTWWGYYPDPELVIQDVIEAGGVVVPAHPFNGYKRRWDERVLELKAIEGIETANGQCTFRSPQANREAAQLADRKQIQTFGGSDAHNPRHVGLCYTQFQAIIETEAELLRAMRLRRARAVTSNKLVQKERRRRQTCTVECVSYDLLPGLTLDNYGDSVQFPIDGQSDRWWDDSEFDPTAH
jgi:predicted metal-dependent phosphoesterase TrpH